MSCPTNFTTLLESLSQLWSSMFCAVRVGGYKIDKSLLTIYSVKFLIFDPNVPIRLPAVTCRRQPCPTRSASTFG